MNFRKVNQNVHKVLSRAKHKGLSRVTQGNKHCSACGQAVTGFTFFSYRPCHCPLCRSTPRERFVAYALQNGLVPELGNRGRVLHVAPGEKSLVRWFQAMGDYVAGDIDPDLYPGQVDRLDLTRMNYEQPFDVIYASHVLEHIPDDRAAMQRMFQHLKPGGIALVLVPLRGDVTEDGPELSEAERTTRFGRPDHVRQYGMNIVDRLGSVGFQVRVVDPAQLDSQVIERHGFETLGYKGEPETDRIFVCVRPID